MSHSAESTRPNQTLHSNDDDDNGSDDDDNDVDKDDDGS